jgi:hypothetical protein
MISPFVLYCVKNFFLALIEENTHNYTEDKPVGERGP